MIHKQYVSKLSPMGALLFQAVRDCDQEQLLYLLQKFPEEVNARDSCEATPLTLASRLNYTNHLRLLLEYSSDPFAQESYEVGLNTALHYAVKNCNREMVLELLSKGVSPNVQNRIGHTPLHIACKNGNFDIVDILVKRGAVSSTRDDSGLSASYWASLKDNEKILKLLPPAEYYTSKQIVEFQMKYINDFDIMIRFPYASKKKKKKFGW